MIHICAVTGSRAEFGLLRPILEEIQKDPALGLRLIVTGAHLSAEFGSTVNEIEDEGYAIAARVDSLVADDTAAGIAESIGRGVTGIGQALAKFHPDLVLILGDRYEILAAAQAALVAKIPVAHVFGGDVTEGAFDESIRHSITKMSHLHFVTHEAAARRVRQLGENPKSVCVSGSPGLDALPRVKRLGREELEFKLGLKFKSKNLLVCFHPVTLAGNEGSSFDQLEAMLEALDELGPDFGLIFTQANADNDGRAINERIKLFVKQHPNSRLFASLGQTLYWSVLAQVNGVVGNSSSGIYEASSFHVPTVNIGDRQKGRPAPESVLHCAPVAHEIQATIERALTLDCSNVVNPYGDGQAAPRIVGGIKAAAERPGGLLGLLRKGFYDSP